MSDEKHSSREAEYAAITGDLRSAFHAIPTFFFLLLIQVISLLSFVEFLGEIRRSVVHSMVGSILILAAIILPWLWFVEERRKQLLTEQILKVELAACLGSVLMHFVSDVPIELTDHEKAEVDAALQRIAFKLERQ